MTSSVAWGDPSRERGVVCPMSVKRQVRESFCFWLVAVTGNDCCCCSCSCSCKLLVAVPLLLLLGFANESPIS